MLRTRLGLAANQMSKLINQRPSFHVFSPLGLAWLGSTQLDSTRLDSTRSTCVVAVALAWLGRAGT